MKITVTAEHIRKGRHQRKGYLRTENCPIARAIKEELGTIPISVALTEVRLGSKGKTHQLPKSAREFIRLLDCSKTTHLAEPFTFEL